MLTARPREIAAHCREWKEGAPAIKKQWKRHSDVNPEPQAIPLERSTGYALDPGGDGFIVFVRRVPIHAKRAELSEPISCQASAGSCWIASNLRPTLCLPKVYLESSRRPCPRDSLV